VAQLLPVDVPQAVLLLSLRLLRGSVLRVSVLRASVPQVEVSADSAAMPDLRKSSAMSLFRT
jgi:hypothetical protein